MESVEDINNRLVDRYGRSVDSNNPNYRIVKAEHQLERRYGVFRDYDDNGIFIREVAEVREVEKYPGYTGRWILEALQYNNANPELLTKVSYEPLWVFGEAGSDPIPVWRAVDLTVHSHKFVERIKKSPSDIRDEEIAQFEKERVICKQILQNEVPYMASALKDGYAVTVASDHCEPVKKDN
jgi:hypothetical protein